MSDAPQAPEGRKKLAQGLSPGIVAQKTERQISSRLELSAAPPGLNFVIDFVPSAFPSASLRAGALG
jgi:hypothetical protein